MMSAAVSRKPRAGLVISFNVSEPTGRACLTKPSSPPYRTGGTTVARRRPKQPTDRLPVRPRKGSAKNPPQGQARPRLPSSQPRSGCTPTDLQHQEWNRNTAPETTCLTSISTAALALIYDNTKPAPQPCSEGDHVAILFVNCSPRSFQNSPFVHIKFIGRNSENLWITGSAELPVCFCRFLPLCRCLARACLASLISARRSGGAGHGENT